MEKNNFTFFSDTYKILNHNKPIAVCLAIYFAITVSSPYWSKQNPMENQRDSPKLEQENTNSVPLKPIFLKPYSISQLASLPINGLEGRFK